MKRYFEMLKRQIRWRVTDKDADKIYKAIVRNIELLLYCVKPRFVPDIACHLGIRKAYGKVKRLVNLNLLRDEGTSQLKYVSEIPEEVLEKIYKFCFCYYCNTRIKYYGGYVHENQWHDPPIKVFCSKKCFEEWINENT